MKNTKINSKFMKEHDARIYLNKSKFNKMTQEQKNKAAAFLSDFQFYLNS